MLMVGTGLPFLVLLILHILQPWACPHCYCGLTLSCLLLLCVPLAQWVFFVICYIECKCHWWSWVHFSMLWTIHFYYWGPSICTIHKYNINWWWDMLISQLLGQFWGWWVVWFLLHICIRCCLLGLISWFIPVSVLSVKVKEEKLWFPYYESWLTFHLPASVFLLLM